MTEKEANTISNTPDLLEFPVLQDIVKSALKSCTDEDDENKNNNGHDDELDEDDDECYTIKVKQARRSTYSGGLFRKPSRLPSIQEESFSSISSKISQAEGEMEKRGQRGFTRTKSLSAYSPGHMVNGFASDKNLTPFNHHNNNNNNANQPFRRKSVLHTLFGEAGDRRFSQDLRPDEDSITSGTLDVESTDKPVFESVETTRVIFYQVFIPFLIAGFDNVGAGVILDRVQHWPVFKNVPELFILVASFLGLKGNLEMTLAARLATMANMGQLDEPKNRMRIATGNIALVQGQAIVVAFLATLIAIVVNFFKEPNFDMEDSLLLCVTGLMTASITGFAMASLMVLATVIARRIGVNPDNVSALIASIMGDISAISLLAFSANTFYEIKHLISIIAPIIIVFYLMLLPACLISARRNPYVKHVVGSGWMPIIVAMLISSAAGFVFDIAVGFFETIAVIQPIVNGVGGNLIAVQASRISTYFHLRYPIGSLPESETGSPCCQTPVSAFRGKHANVKTARLLLLMSIPIHAVYFTTICIIKRGEVVLTFSFITCYLTVVVVQVACLLYSAHILVPYLWRLKLDPDNTAVPALMAIADLLGTCLLTSAYFFLLLIRDPYVSNQPFTALSSLSVEEVSNVTTPFTIGLFPDSSGVK